MEETQVEITDVTSTQVQEVVVETLKPGDGDERPSQGDRVTVHYVGKLSDGTVFDSSRERLQPFDFTLGKGEVIKGWDIGVAKMRKHELARIICPPAYAYGEKGSPPNIPPNATLTFEVELLGWAGQDITKKKDGGVLKRVVKQGEKYATPNEGATVTIKYTGQHEGRVFESQEVTFTQGEGEDSGIIAGLELATQKMKQGEIDELTISPKYAYGDEGCTELGIPPNAKLVYNVEMISFEKAKDTWQMELVEKIEQCKIFKQKGTDAFRKGNYRRALTNYEKIVSYLEHETTAPTDKEHGEKQQLMLSAHLNLSMCHLKMNNLRKAEESCDKVLEMDANNVKAFFRRGQARLELNEYSKASEDFSRVLELEPDNKAAKNQLIVCRQKEKAAYVREKALYANMFKKMAEQSNRDRGDQAVPEVGEWNNDMAKNMMPLQEERDAFEDSIDIDKKDSIPADDMEV